MLKKIEFEKNSNSKFRCHLQCFSLFFRLEQMKRDIGMDDLRSKRPWEQQSAQLRFDLSFLANFNDFNFFLNFFLKLILKFRDLEDTIEQTISEKPKPQNHLYAKDIVQQNSVS